jgi:hypothetical protein
VIKISDISCFPGHNSQNGTHCLGAFWPETIYSCDQVTWIIYSGGYLIVTILETNVFKPIFALHLLFWEDFIRKHFRIAPRPARFAPKPARFATRSAHFATIQTCSFRDETCSFRAEILRFTYFFPGGGVDGWWGRRKAAAQRKDLTIYISCWNKPISTTAPIDAKTHVWPIDGIAQWLTNQRSLLGHIQAKKKKLYCRQKFTSA